MGSDSDLEDGFISGLILQSEFYGISAVIFFKLDVCRV